MILAGYHGTDPNFTGGGIIAEHAVVDRGLYRARMCNYGSDLSKLLKFPRG